MERPDHLAFIGFGEAAHAFCEGWGEARPGKVQAYDRKTDTPGMAGAKRLDFRRYAVDGYEECATAIANAPVIISVVTADQALVAARDVAHGIAEGAIYLDMNSVAPETKRIAADAIRSAGGRYVDVAVMAPVRPALLDVPILISGPDAGTGLEYLAALGFRGRIVSDSVGAASAIKMIRSIMVKGIEALTAECLLSAYAAGVEEEVLTSLDASFPGFDWRSRADYNLDRMIVHGLRRGEEMREAAATAARLGQTGEMARAAADWQARVGALSLPSHNGLDAKVDALLRATGQRP